jgi:hypothetical protein
LGSFWSDWILSDTLFSSLVSMLLFDIPLSDIVPWLLNWSIELPTVDEFLRGVLIKLEPIDITYSFPELTSIFDTVWTVFTDEFAEGVAGTRLVKAIYGQSRYDESYYDPEAVREFLRSTLYAFTKKNVSWSEVRTRVEKAAQQLGVPEDLARTVFDRLSMITSIKETAATWDYAWWDTSSWSPETRSGAVEFVTYDLTTESGRVRAALRRAGERSMGLRVLGLLLLVPRRPCVQAERGEAEGVLRRLQGLHRAGLPQPLPRHGSGGGQLPDRGGAQDVEQRAHGDLRAAYVPALPHREHRR